MSTRDPRLDPRPGDVVDPKGYWRQWVLERSEQKLKVRGRFEAYEMSLGRWKAMARNATVIHTAPEAE